MSSDSDQAFAIRASRGDVEAFRMLVHEHSGLVYRVALRILGSEDAQDASQEVWIRVWRNMKNFRGESAFSTWLYRITVNTCLSVRRKESRRGDAVPARTARRRHRPGSGRPRRGAAGGDTDRPRPRTCRAQGCSGPQAHGGALLRRDSPGPRSP